MGSYGQDCELKCPCENRARCHHVTGKCECAPGYTGERCENGKLALMDDGITSNKVVFY